MRVIPAIDIINGKCVRLYQGRYDKEKVYDEDPVAMAIKWKDEGASLIHVVDLDGARMGNVVNIETINNIRKAVDIDIEVGGGIRKEDDVKLLIDIGINRIIIGSMIIYDFKCFENICNTYNGYIVAGIDSKMGTIAFDGWVSDAGVAASAIINKLNDISIAGIIWTDITRDGTLEGVNIDDVKDMASISRHPLVVAGGVRGLDDIRAIYNLNMPIIDGVIVGKALYENKISLREAIREFERRQ